MYSSEEDKATAGSEIITVTEIFIEIYLMRIEIVSETVERHVIFTVGL